jgi:hypothetical protein
MPAWLLTFLITAVLSSSTIAARASTADDAAESQPAIRRWLEVEQLQLTSRFRWIETTNGSVTSSSVQWQPQLKTRVPFDARGRYSVNVGAFGGSSFTSGWNNTGAGIGAYAGTFTVKQLFVQAEPHKSIALSTGGLYLLRGESTEITSYDNDGFIVGERGVWRPRSGAITQVALTGGYLGDLREPNVFHRLDRLDEWNYGQLLLGWRVGAHVVASTDYTHDGDRDTLRAAMTVRLPRRTKVLTSVKLDLYERVSPDTAHGLNVSADLRPLQRLAVTTGFAHVDRDFGGLNADRFDRGTKAYSLGTYSLTNDLSVGWFVAEAVANDYALANEHRVELLLTINPIGTLRQHRIF